jgi:hypothetical protein
LRCAYVPAKGGAPATPRAAARTLPYSYTHGGLLASTSIPSLIFNEGYTATAGADWVRPALCDDALRLGRILAELAPDEPEVHGLVALMEIQASRLRARWMARSARTHSRRRSPLPCARADRRGDSVGPHQLAVRTACRNRPLAGRGAQPGGRRRERELLLERAAGCSEPG